MENPIISSGRTSFRSFRESVITSSTGIYIHKKWRYFVIEIFLWQLKKNKKKKRKEKGNDGQSNFIINEINSKVTLLLKKTIYEFSLVTIEMFLYFFSQVIIYSSLISIIAIKHLRFFFFFLWSIRINTIRSHIYIFIINYM